MIFVTVGTHEQPFDRLVREVDRLKAAGEIAEDVMIQTGFCTYVPKVCKWSKWLSYQEMQRYNSEASVVITHGGPSSFIAPLQYGKIPIVVPRKKIEGEHVNDHQVAFARQVAERYRNIIVVPDVEKLGEILRNYDRIIAEMNAGVVSNNARFNQELEKIAGTLVGGRK